MCEQGVKRSRPLLCVHPTLWCVGVGEQSMDKVHTGVQVDSRICLCQDFRRSISSCCRNARPRTPPPPLPSSHSTHLGVRIVHLPTGLAVKCTQERSQLQNRVIAMGQLRAKLLVVLEEQQAKEVWGLASREGGGASACTQLCWTVHAVKCGVGCIPA